jgi:hypothetical protein
METEGREEHFENGPCEACMVMDETWKDRMVDEMVVYNSKIEIGT